MIDDTVPPGKVEQGVWNQDDEDRMAEAEQVDKMVETTQSQQEHKLREGENLVCCTSTESLGRRAGPKAPGDLSESSKVERLLWGETIWQRQGVGGAA